MALLKGAVLLQMDMSGPSPASQLTGHKAPILQLKAGPGALASGDRSGGLAVWDLTIGVASWRALDAHDGHVTALTWSQSLHPTSAKEPVELGIAQREAGSAGGRKGPGSGDGSERLRDKMAASRPHAVQLTASSSSSGHAVGPPDRGSNGDALGGHSDPAGCSSQSCILSGGQDGLLKTWDARAGPRPVQTIALHVMPKGRGAISEILSPQPATAGMAVTAGADGSVAVADPRAGSKMLGRVKLTDFPYSLTAVGGLAVCGCGDGSLHVIDAAMPATLYALGAQKAAVRTVWASGDQLVCSGDDGSVLCFDMAA